MELVNIHIMHDVGKPDIRLVNTFRRFGGVLCLLLLVLAVLINNLISECNYFSLVGISGLNWIGHVNRMDSKRKGSQVFNNNRRGSRLRGRLKYRWCSCVHIDINEWKIQMVQLCTHRY
jgi:hypothetical protein